jgi:hypothetical protein
MELTIEEIIEALNRRTPEAGDLFRLAFMGAASNRWKRGAVPRTQHRLDKAYEEVRQEWEEWINRALNGDASFLKPDPFILMTDPDYAVLLGAVMLLKKC